MRLILFKIIKIIRELLVAAQFLTAIPIRFEKSPAESDFAKSIAYFPFVGAILGLALGIFYLSLRPFLDHMVICAFVIALEIFLTGGIHIDGFCDTIDGFSSSNKKETILSVMKDSHIGSMAVVAVILLLLIKFSILTSIHFNLFFRYIILMTVLSRWSLVISCRFFPYARQKEGKARQFVGKASAKQFAIASIFVIVLSLFLIDFWKAGLIIGITGLSTFGFNLFVLNKISGITGDTLGALNEIIGALVILLAVIL